jgi:hypothetical protein
MDTIFTAHDAAANLSVRVAADWPAGRFIVTFRDDDADATIEHRTYSNPDAALQFARKLIGA